jgi:orotate phosphoribosyltransferase
VVQNIEVDVASLLSSVGARRGHFLFESGHHGDFWLDLETLCARPAVIAPLAAELAARIRPYRIDAVCGPFNEGALVALLVATELECDFTYAERYPNPERGGMFPIDYRLPAAQHALVRARRVAIINDVVSAGSAVRGACADLERLGAQVVAVGALAVLGTPFVTFARERALALEALAHLPHHVWAPSECPLCVRGVPLEAVESQGIGLTAPAGRHTLPIPRVS